MSLWTERGYVVWAPGCGTSIHLLSSAMLPTRVANRDCSMVLSSDWLNMGSSPGLLGRCGSRCRFRLSGRLSTPAVGKEQGRQQTVTFQFTKGEETNFKVSEAEMETHTLEPQPLLRQGRIQSSCWCLDGLESCYLCLLSSGITGVHVRLSQCWESNQVSPVLG